MNLSEWNVSLSQVVSNTVEWNTGRHSGYRYRPPSYSYMFNSFEPQPTPIVDSRSMEYYSNGVAKPVTSNVYVTAETSLPDVLVVCGTR